MDSFFVQRILGAKVALFCDFAFEDLVR